MLVHVLCLFANRLLYYCSDEAAVYAHPHDDSVIFWDVLRFHTEGSASSLVVIDVPCDFVPEVAQPAPQPVVAAVVRQSVYTQSCATVKSVGASVAVSQCGGAMSLLTQNSGVGGGAADPSFQQEAEGVFATAVGAYEIGRVVETFADLIMVCVCSPTSCCWLNCQRCAVRARVLERHGTIPCMQHCVSVRVRDICPPPFKVACFAWLCVCMRLSADVCGGCAGHVSKYEWVVGVVLL